MDGVQFFKSPEVNLPLMRQTDDFESFMKDVFDRYLKVIRDMSPGDDITTAIKADYKEIEALCDFILQALSNTSKGLPQQAYNRLNEGITAVWTRLQRLIIQKPDHPQLNEMWRIRVAGPEGGAFQKKDLFHIPFEKRHVVKRQRYSIPGLPCLYLGGTLYICWEELGRPSFESVYLARFGVAKGENVRLLDLSARPRLIVQIIQQQNNPKNVSLRDYCLAHANCWPLMAASSVRRMYVDAPFVSEYIIPQLLLQWVTHRDQVDGIAYFSVNLDSVSTPPLGTANIVFPATDIQATGICSKLRRKFAMSEPAAWQLIANNPVAAGSPLETVNKDMQVELIRGRPILYRASQFGRIEGEMLKLASSTF